ncbi:hemagglutinin repeat-containing protein [Lysobacter sp. A421]
MAGTGDVALVAGNDITIETAENTLAGSHSSHTKRSGLFGTGGVGFTIGTQTRESTADITELTHTGSLIGSTEGRVDIVAGGDAAMWRLPAATCCRRPA